MSRHFLRIYLLLFILGLMNMGESKSALAQSPDGSWSDFENISDTPTASTYPCIVTDKQGYVHVLWSEDVGGVTDNPLKNPDGTPVLDPSGNPLNYLTNSGNTLYYTRWEGKDWTEPIDVQVNPSGNIQYPRAAIDPVGVLHVIWVSTYGEATQLQYSRVLANKADSPQEWSQSKVLVERTLYALYPADIAADTEGGLHILYFKLGENPGAYVINSSDGGDTWSDPLQIYQTQDSRGSIEGISSVELVIDQKNRIHATWTRFDISGNGKAIYYSQSTDLGKTWSQPFEVAKWQPGWYETDWLSAGVVGDEVHLVWEGGQIAYQNERISNDGGKTWGENVFILQNLVGENGFANLVVDSANHLHMLIVKRADPGAYAHGVWYTTWDRGQWVDPILLGTRNLLLYEKASKLDQKSLQAITRGTFTGNGLRYQMSGIVNGNQLFVVVVNEYDGDIWSSHTTLDAPFISPYPYATPTPLPSLQPLSTPTETIINSTPTVEFQTNEPVQEVGTQPADILLLGVIPALFVVAGIIFFIFFYKRS